MEQSLRSRDTDPFVRWSLLQRGPWVHGKETLFEYIADAVRFEVSPVGANIRCPTVVTLAEGDPIAAGAQKLFDAVVAERKILIRFTESEGAGGYCEGKARHLFHQRCYDWLDQALDDGCRKISRPGGPSDEW